MNADRWSDLVEKGRDLVRQEGDTKWALGDLALEAQHFHGVEAQHFRGDLLRYAEEIGIALHTLRRYRDVAVAWPPALRSAGHPWSVYKELAAAPDRVRLIQSRDRWTVEEARQAVGHAPPGRHRPPSSGQRPSRRPWLTPRSPGKSSGTPGRRRRSAGRSGRRAGSR